MTKMNTKAYGSSNHGKQFTEDQHKKGKKWYITHAPMRTKKRWNKKKGVQEISKKGSKEYYFWCD